MSCGTRSRPGRARRRARLPRARSRPTRSRRRTTRRRTRDLPAGAARNFVPSTNGLPWRTAVTESTRSESTPGAPVTRVIVPRPLPRLGTGCAAGDDVGEAPRAVVIEMVLPSCNRPTCANGAPYEVLRPTMSTSPASPGRRRRRIVSRSLLDVPCGVAFDRHLLEPDCRDLQEPDRVADRGGRGYAAVGGIGEIDLELAQQLTLAARLLHARHPVLEDRRARSQWRWR